MIAKICHVVDKKTSEMSSQFEALLEATLTDCVKAGMVESDPSRDKFHRRVQEILKPYFMEMESTNQEESCLAS